MRKIYCDFVFLHSFRKNKNWVLEQVPGIWEDVEVHIYLVMEHRVQIWEGILATNTWYCAMVVALCSIVQHSGIVTSLQIDVGKWL